MSDKKIININDIQIHSSYHQNKKSFKRGVDKSIKNGKDGRFYFKPKDLKIIKDDGKEVEFSFIIPIEDVKKYNIKIVNGVPICLGKDTKEKLDSLKNK